MFDFNWFKKIRELFNNTPILVKTDEEIKLEEKYQRISKLLKWATEFRETYKISTADFILRICNTKPDRTGIKILSDPNFLRYGSKFADQIEHAMDVYKDGFTEFIYDHPPFTDLEKMEHCIIEFFFKEVDAAMGCGFPYMRNDGKIKWSVPKTENNKVQIKDVVDFFTRHDCKVPDILEISHIEYV